MMSCDDSDKVIHVFCALKYRNGNDQEPLVPRLLHPWWHPAAIIPVDNASLSMPNVENHMIARVIAALT